MFVACFAAAALTLTDGTDAAWEKRVEALIRQLDDASFTRREAAQQALLAEGEKIVPLLDRARPDANLELRRRIERIRYQLVGYADELTAHLQRLSLVDPDSRPELPADLTSAVAAYQPKTGDLLLKLIADPKHRLRRAAVWVFCHTWQSASAAQVDRYLQTVFTLKAYHRDRYPLHVPALIETRYYLVDGWLGFPKDLVWETVTTLYLDGQPHGKPYRYDYPGPAATTGWVPTGALPEGKHTLHFVVQYSFTHRGVKRQGQVRSRDFTFAIAAAAQDDLQAPADPAHDALLQKVFSIRAHEYEEQDKALIIGRGEDLRVDPWQPQVTWKNAAGRTAGIHVPVWKLSQALPVDLCFEVELRDKRTGQTFKGDGLIAKRGKIGQGYFTPRDARAFAAGRDGFVEVELRLTPSRALALTDPEVTRYYPGTITRTLRCKVFAEVPENEPRK